MLAEHEEYLIQLYTGPLARDDPDFEFTVLDENISVVTKVDDKASRNPFAYMFEDEEDEEYDEDNPDGNWDKEDEDKEEDRDGNEDEEDKVASDVKYERDNQKEEEEE